MDFSDLREPVNAWTHAFGLVLSVLATLSLWARSRGVEPARRASLVVFGLGLSCCYAASMLFHGVRRTGLALAPFDRLDRVGILVLIAGTYTPLAWTLLRPRPRVATLAIVWGITLVASALLAVGGPLSQAWMTGLYLVMGWGAVAFYAELARLVGHRALSPLILGGACYSVGAVLNVARWPVIWPGVFGPHEIFHLFVIAGSLCHYRLIARVVLPFDRSASFRARADPPGASFAARGPAKRRPGSVELPRQIDA